MAPPLRIMEVWRVAGWKAQKGTAIHPDNAQGRYYRELLEHASLRGEAVVYQYLFDDRIVAMNLCLARKQTLIVLKTTYDESIQVTHRLSSARSRVAGALCGAEDPALGILRRLMEWHTKWTDQKRTFIT